MATWVSSINASSTTQTISACISTAEFDPAQNKYIRPAPNYQWPNLLRGAQTPRHSVYNPVTDEVIMMGQDGGSGNFALRMNAQTGVWTRDDGLASDAIDGSYINDAQA